jgi:hypothetical protein
MISKDKTYRTRDGREVRIYATDGAGDWPAHGAVLTELGWLAFRWRADGASTFSNSPYRDDLIEVKPRIKRTVWLNVYDDKRVGLYYNRKNADEDMEYVPSSYKRLACVKVEIDCEEGEGL